MIIIITNKTKSMIAITLMVFAVAGFFTIGAMSDNTDGEGTVIYNAVFLDGDDVVTVVTGTGGTILTAPDMTEVENEGYTFNGWDPEVPETLTANGVYKAIWKANDGSDEPTDYEQGYEDGYKDGVASVEQDFTQDDIDNSYDEGYKAGMADAPVAETAPQNNGNWITYFAVALITCIVLAIALLWGMNKRKKDGGNFF